MTGTRRTRGALMSAMYEGILLDIVVRGSIYLASLSDDALEDVAVGVR